MDAFLPEMNMLLEGYPQRASLCKQGSEVVLNPFFEPRRPEDVWAPIVAAAPELLSELEPSRVRERESESCFVHFLRTRKKDHVASAA